MRAPPAEKSQTLLTGSASHLAGIVESERRCLACRFGETAQPLRLVMTSEGVFQAVCASVFVAIDRVR